MGIFNDPERLAKFLASVKVHTTERPLSPIQVSEYIQEAIEELGDEKEVMKRLDIGPSMMNGFKNLRTKVSEDIVNAFNWGKTNVQELSINFTTAQLMSTLEPEIQNRLFSYFFEAVEQGIDFPTKEDFKRIKEHYNKNKPNITIDDAIAYILKTDMPPAGFTSAAFMALLNENVFEKLREEAKKRNSTLKEVTLQILRKKLGADFVQSVKIMESGIIRILFSLEGKKEFDRIVSSKKIKKNEFVNNLIGDEV